MFNSVPCTEISINDTDTLCQHYLNIVYHDLHYHHKNNHLSETQGEILYAGVDKLLSIIKLTEHDVFFDLGSAIGKVVAQVFLKSAVKESCGIEFVPELHQQAFRAAQKIQNDLPDFYVGGRKLTFLLNNFLEVPLAMATVVLINSICLNQQTLYVLENIIDKTPSIRLVLALRPLSKVQRLRFKRTVRIECSWDTVLCYIYEE